VSRPRQKGASRRRDSEAAYGKTPSDQGRTSRLRPAQGDRRTGIRPDEAPTARRSSPFAWPRWSTGEWTLHLVCHNLRKLANAGGRLRSRQHERREAPSRAQLRTPRNQREAATTGQGPLSRLIELRNRAAFRFGPTHLASRPDSTRQTWNEPTSDSWPGTAATLAANRLCMQFEAADRISGLSGATPTRWRSTDPPERDQLLRAFRCHRQPLQLHREDGGVPTALDVAATCRPATSPRSDKYPRDGRLFGYPQCSTRRMQ